MILFNKFSRASVIISLFAVLALPAFPAYSVETGQAAPDFTLPGVRPEDPRTTLSELQGKVVYVDFWASWCLPCLRSLPEINGLYEKYRDQGFEVLALTIDAPVTQRNSWPTWKHHWHTHCWRMKRLMSCMTMGYVACPRRS